MYRSDEMIRALIAAFEAGTLPREAWTHAAHLTVALWYVSRLPPGEATARIREGIKNYNEAVGVRQTSSGGYHETITRFWITVVARWLASFTADVPLWAKANELILQYGNQTLLPLSYWSRDRLFSWEARTGWVEPDLQNLA